MIPSWYLPAFVVVAVLLGCADPRDQAERTTRQARQLSQGQQTAAWDQLDVAVAWDRDYAPAHRLRGELFFNARRYRLALESLDRALQLDSSDTTSRLIRGRCYLALNRATDALADLDKVLDQDDSPQTQQDAGPARAEALRELGRFDEARQQLTTLLDAEGASDLKRSPVAQGRFLQLLYQRGKTAQEAGDLQAAEADFRQMVRIDPNRPAARIGLAGLALSQGQLNQALSEIDRSLDQWKLDSEALLVRAEVLLRLGRLQEGLHDINQVMGLALNPPLAAVQIRGRLRLALGQYDQAKKDLAKVAILTPGDPSAQMDLGQLALQQSDWDQARQAFGRVVSLDPQDPSAHHGMALASLRAGQLAEALTHVNQAIQLNEFDPEFYLTRADISEAFGQTEAAAADIGHAADLSEMSLQPGGSS